MWLVYFLQSARGNWYYVGSTNNIERRLQEHNGGKVLSTKHHAPLKLVYTNEFKDETSARAFEQKIKKQRLLKEKIVRTIEENCRIV